MKVINKLLKNQDGAVIVFVAIGMVVMLGAVGLVVDGGKVLLERNRLQKAVDAAALAGVQELPVDKSKAITIATETSVLNGYESPSIDIPDSKESITVTENKEVNLTFARLLGFENMNVSARAKVNVQGPITSATGLLPIGLNLDRFLEEDEENEITDLVPGKVIELMWQENDSGNFGALDYWGSGAKDYGDYMENGYPDVIKVNDKPYTETGVMTKHSAKVEAHKNKVVLVPIYQCVNCQTDKDRNKKYNGKVQVEILGIMSIKIIDILGSPKKGVKGQIVQTTVTGGGAPSQTNFGTYAYKFVE